MGGFAKGGLGSVSWRVLDGHRLASWKDRRKGASDLHGVKDEVCRGCLAGPACVLHTGDSHNVAEVLEMGP